MIDNFLKIMLVLLITLVSCNSNNQKEKSNFNLKKDFSDFSKRMSNNDTLNINFNLSACSWFEFDEVEITMKNDTLYYQIKERIVWEDKEEPIYFPKVEYKFSQDTMSLEKLIINLPTEKNQGNSNPFLVLTNPKENDSIFLYTRNLGDRILNIEKYNILIQELYPKEMELYYLKYPKPEILPLPPEFNENE